MLLWLNPSCGDHSSSAPATSSLKLLIVSSSLVWCQLIWYTIFLLCVATAPNFSALTLSAAPFTWMVADHITSKATATVAVATDGQTIKK
jgi:hypothetical protein